ncbi:MAG: LON peptidase substrate-binding domain-containing protein [Gammaproteobacteria bacterium]|nr:LON peptidase substrate-binding domain-containing protein [Gammaproteobacteria bacterium]
MEIPLFPLHSILFPGGALPLRIFESRYIDLVSRCLREESGFGICMIRQGQEVGEAADVYDYGTYARIGYFEQLDNGLLGITMRGETRFRIQRTWVESNSLLMGEVSLLPDEVSQALAPEHQPLSELLHQIIDRLGPPYSTLPASYDDAAWVSQRLTELLPFDPELKQYFLQLDEPSQRLERMLAILSRT